MAIVTKAGMHGCTPAEYHADPCPFGPSMSASNAQDLINRSPGHAWHNHPRLNPHFQAWDGNGATAEGAALHSMILGVGSPIKLIEANDYRTNAAKEAREAARAAGEIPVLKKDMERLERIQLAVQDQIAGHPDLRSIINSRGRAETTMLWRDGFTWCRSLVDYMPDDPAAPLLDFKFTSRDASPDDYSRQIQTTMGLRAFHYLRGANQVRDVRPAGYWLVVVEVDEPFGMHVHAVGESLLHYERPAWFAARDKWASCLAHGTERRYWPLYSPVVNVVEIAAWQKAKADERARYLAEDYGDPIGAPSPNALAAMDTMGAAE